MVCNKCEDKTPIEIPYAVYESETTRYHSIVKYLIVVIILLITMLVGTNVCWIVYESQYETVNEVVIEQDTSDGSNNYANNGGEINNGTSENN